VPHSQEADRSVGQLIDDDPARGLFRVHRSTCTSEDLFRVERERIFERVWLYVGHDSEVAQRGDFVRRTVGGRPLFFVRGTDGRVRVFFNTCTHRGALVCRQDQGNANTFQCFYHAWTFDTQGELVGRPGREGYSATCDTESLALRSPARVDRYRGLYFMSLDPDIVPLNEYLGPVREWIDLVLDQTEASWEVLPGTNLYSIKANWKLMVENTVDNYHVAPTHATFLNYVQTLNDGTATRAKGALGPFDLGNGHAVLELGAPYGRPIARWSAMFGEEAKGEIADLRARLDERFGPERAHRMAECIRLILVYPNLLLNDISAVTLRYVEPVAVDRMDVTAWALAPTDESAAGRQRRIDSFVSFLGPGGLATPDDIEALESCQMGFAAREVEWSDVSRGAGMEPFISDETPLRAFWRQWWNQMSPGPQPTVIRAIPR
jgi:p-cumate 2,3-dioxygenase subunit alpha